jgi:hypothetical protein
LKFGTYGDIGYKTCQGLAGFHDHFEEDAQTLADWKVDYIKVDGCNENQEESKGFNGFQWVSMGFNGFQVQNLKATRCVESRTWRETILRLVLP